MLRHRLLYTAVALAMTPAMGCVFVSNDDGSNGNGNGNGNGDARGHFDVIWKVEGLSETGDGCLELPGSDYVEIVSAPTDGGQTIVDQYDCEDGGAVTPLLPLGDYEVWTNVRDSDGRLLAQSQIVPTTLDFDGQLLVVEEELQFLNAQFEASWDIREDITDDPLSCGDVGAEDASILSTLAGSSGTGFDDLYNCEDGLDPEVVETAPLALADYTISVSLLDGSESVVSQAEPVDASLDAHATVEDLGIFEFTFAPEGTGFFDVAWKVTGRDDAGDGCEELPGVAGVEIVSERVDDGTRVVDVFNCGDGQADTSDLPLGDYDVWMNVIDDNDRLLASSQVQQVLLDSRDEPVQVPNEFVFLNAQFEALWDIRENDGSLSSCQGEEAVSFVSTLAGSGGTGFDDIFDCTDGTGDTPAVFAPLPLGEYTIDATLLNADEQVIGQADELIDAVLEEHATVKNLNVIDIFLDA